MHVKKYSYPLFPVPFLKQANTLVLFFCFFVNKAIYYFDFPKNQIKKQGYRTKRVDGLIPFNKRSVIIM